MKSSKETDAIPTRNKKQSPTKKQGCMESPTRHSCRLANKPVVDDPIQDPSITPKPGRYTEVNSR
jgi:hypothetical protein